MNISDVSIRLTSEDIKSMIDDFLHIPGLNISEISIDKHIAIKGSFKKIVTFPFLLEVSLDRVEKHNIMLMLNRVEIIKVPVFKWIQNLVLKKVIKSLKEIGLTYDQGKVDMHLPTLMKLLPIRLQFDLHSLELGKDLVHIELNKISLRIQEVKEEAGQKEEALKNNNISVDTRIPAADDAYTRIRKKIDRGAPAKYKEVLSYIMIMPDIAALFVRLFRDKRVPVKAKIICGSVIAYFALPIDILPDFIPVIGSIDDFAIAFYALNKILCEVPEKVVVDNWQGKDDIILIIRTGVNLIQKYIGGTNVAKACRWLINSLRAGNTGVNKAVVKEKDIDGKESICHKGRLQQPQGGTGIQSDSGFLESV